nr:MAG TPA: hypothetical protein [Caudoviricetes sp.]
MSKIQRNKKCRKPLILAGFRHFCQFMTMLFYVKIEECKGM